jgi:hypothetical protein
MQVREVAPSECRSFGIEEVKMGFQRILGVLLILIGVIGLAYQGITYTHRKKVLDIGPIQATKTERATVPLPPILGGVALVGGIGLVVLSNGNRP